MIDTKKIREINPMVIGNDCQSNVIHELCDEIDALRDQLASTKSRLQELQGQLKQFERQPIETAPKDQKILIGFPDENEIKWIQGIWTGNSWGLIWMPSQGCGCCGESDPEPLFWMPLPEIKIESPKKEPEKSQKEKTWGTVPLIFEIAGRKIEGFLENGGQICLTREIVAEGEK